GIPSGGLAFVVGGEELLAHLPRLVHAQRVADHAQDLAGGRLRVIGREPRHRRRGVPRVHAVELGVLLRVLDRDVLARLADHARETTGPDAVGANAVASQLEAGDDRHGRDPGLGRAVVRLAGLALEAGARDRVDDGRAGLAALLGLC